MEEQREGERKILEKSPCPAQSPTWGSISLSPNQESNVQPSELPKRPWFVFSSPP